MKRFKIYILTTELFIFPSDSQICMIYTCYLLLQLGGPLFLFSFFPFMKPNLSNMNAFYSNFQNHKYHATHDKAIKSGNTGTSPIALELKAGMSVRVGGIRAYFASVRE